MGGRSVEALVEGRDAPRTQLFHLASDPHELNDLLLSDTLGRGRAEELRALLAKALDVLPDAERKRYFSQRQRPRRTGKPL